MNDAYLLTSGQFHGDIIDQQCFSCSRKTGEAEISGSAGSEFLKDLALNVPLLGSKEILFLQETCRLCDGGDQIQFCLKQIIDIPLIIFTFSLQCSAQIIPVGIYNMIMVLLYLLLIRPDI